MAGIRDLGYVVGAMPTGERNLITDVKGVRVGHCTIDHGDVHTGVTVVLPVEGNVFRKRPVAACHVQNGFGKTFGTVQLEELGCLETPIALTNTLCVGRVADALVSLVLEENPFACSVSPVVGETNDVRINNIRIRAIEEAHVKEAITSAGTQFEQGSVGAGRGTVCFGLKGGIGSASRITHVCGEQNRLGVLVQSNFGKMEDLLVCGQPLGRHITKKLHRADAAATFNESEKGSIMVVVATDVPLSCRQLRRVLKRTTVGMARTGSFLGHGSGDVFVGFTTANALPVGAKRPLAQQVVPDEQLDPLFRATAEATEEAILNSLVLAQPDVGLDGSPYHSLAEYLSPNDCPH